MAQVKNFGIRGIGSDVQFGKNGGRVVYDSGNSLFKVTTDGTTLGHMNVATTPTADNHATSKAYVDSVASGLDVKDSVRAASTANVNVSEAPSTIDGVNLSSGDRVLLKNQTTSSQNGIYVFNGAASAMTRAADMNESGEFVGAFFFVEEGTVNSDQGFVMSSNGPITVDTSDIEFTKFTGTGQITAGDALSKNGNTLNVEVDDTYVRVVSDALTLKGTSTTGEVLKSDGAGGVVYGALDLTNASAISGALPLTNGGLGVDASQTAGKATARDNLGLGSIATQDANSVAITGGSIDISGGTLTLADDQISGDKVSGGTIDSANLQGGTGITISQFDITVGAGKTLDVDGVLDVDGAAGSAIDNVVIGATTSAAGTFSNLTSDNVDLNGGNIDGTVIGATTAANATFVDANVSGVLKVDEIESYTTDGDITFNSLIVTTQGINVANAGITGAGSITTGDIKVDNIFEKTSGNGVDVDGVLLKDGNVTANVGTFTSTVVTSADINGGNIDGTVIGGAASAAATFSTMTTDSADINGGTISGTAIDMTGQTLTFDDDAISGDKIDGGSISNFASTGIDDNASSTQITVSDAEVSFGADVAVTGNLTVSGTLTSVNTTNTEIADNSIVLNKGETAAGVTAGTAGIEIDRGSEDSATLQWNETDDVWEFKVGTALADLKIGSQAMDAISVDTVNELTPGAGISFADAISGGDATFSGTMSVDTIAENTVGGGVTVDGVILKDGVVTAGLTAEASDTVDVSAASLVLADDQISGDKIEGGTIAAITIDSLTSGTVDIDGGAIDATVIGGTTSAAGTFSALTSDSVDLNGGAMDGVIIGANASAAATFSSMTTASADINGGAIDGTVIGAASSAAGTFSTMTTNNAQVTGGAISGATLTSDTVDLNGGAIDGTVIGGSVSAAGTFSTLTTNNATITGGNVTATGGTFTDLSSGNVNLSGGSVAGTDIDMTGQTLSLDNDQINGDKVHGGSISSANLVGSANTMAGYDITVGAGRTLDVSSGTLTLADDQISGDKVDGGTISNFASTGIDDNATATKITLSDTAATFGVAGDFGANDLDAGAASFASLNVSGDAVVEGNLTVSGAVTTTLSETVAIEDNIIQLNSNEAAAPTLDAGFEVVRGTSSNVSFLWDETNDTWTLGTENLTVGDVTANELTLANELSLDNGGTHTDTSAYAADSIMIMDGVEGVSELAKGSNSTVLKVNASGALGYAKVDLTADVDGTLPVANGGTGLTAVGSDNKVLMSDGSANGYEYVSHLRNGSGVAVVDASNAASGSGEYLDLTNAAGKLTLTAKNASGSGAVDMYLQGQNGGDVFIVGQSGEALIQGEADTDLTVAGGDSSTGAAGDLILKGGNGSANGASGAVIIKGGNGGSADGNVQVKGADDTAIATFVEAASAADNFTMTNGTGSVQLAGVGSSADVNMVLAPKGDGLVLAPSGYDMSGGAGHAFVTKDYVDGSTAGSVDFGVRRVSFAANGASSFTVGTVANVAGKSYYVSKVTVKVTTAFVGADELVITDGTNTLVDTTDVDLSEGGIYVIDLGYENATAGGSTISAAIQNGGSSASPTTGNVIVTAEFKQM
jgi:hypothetical protein